MFELGRTRLAVIRCFSTRETLDAFPPVAGAFACRVAPDELLLLAGEGDAERVVGAAAVYLADCDPGGLALDHSDGWAVCTLAGADCGEALARLSSLPLPETRPTFLQGAVAAVPAKVVAADDRLDVLVPASLGDYLIERIEAACRDLGPRRGPVRPATLETAAMEAT